MRKTAGNTSTDCKTNTHIAKELKITTILDKLQEYKRNWIQFDILLPVYHYASQQRNQLNTLSLSLSQTLYCVLILYMFRAPSVHLQEALH
jgi:hypothetical protein